MQTISATDLARNTREILDKVASRGETVIIERNHTTIAQIMPPLQTMTASQALVRCRQQEDSQIHHRHAGGNAQPRRQAGQAGDRLMARKPDRSLTVASLVPKAIRPACSPALWVQPGATLGQCTKNTFVATQNLRGVMCYLRRCALPGAQKREAGQGFP